MINSQFSPWPSFTLEEADAIHKVLMSNKVNYWTGNECREFEKEFAEFLKCGRLEHGFLRVVCDDCKHEKLLAFSCKKRGFSPSCGARRMAESAKLLVDDVLNGYPVRQWVLSLPIPLRLLLTRYPKHLSNIMQIIHRAIATDIIHRAGYLKKQANTEAVTYIQRFGSALKRQTTMI